MNLTFSYVDFRNPSAFTPNLCSLSDVSAAASSFLALFLGVFRVKSITSYSLCLLQVVRIHFALLKFIFFLSFIFQNFLLPSSFLLLVYHFTFVFVKLLEGMEIKCVFNLLMFNRKSNSLIRQVSRYFKFNP